VYLSISVLAASVPRCIMFAQSKSHGHDGPILMFQNVELRSHKPNIFVKFVENS